MINNFTADNFCRSQSVPPEQSVVSTIPFSKGLTIGGSSIATKQAAPKKQVTPKSEGTLVI